MNNYTIDAATILREAASIIELRAIERDLPKERSMARAVKAFNIIMGMSLSETQGWMFMLILKLARETAGRHNRDDLLDAAAYAALALEAEELSLRTEELLMNMENPENE